MPEPAGCIGSADRLPKCYANRSARETREMAMSTTILPQSSIGISADALPDEKGFEVIDGRLVEKHMGWESTWVASRLFRHLDTFSEAHHLGWTNTGEAGYQCFPHRPKLARKPDVSVVRLGRLPDEVFPRGYCTIAPDLVAEVVSPNDTAEEIEERVVDYRLAGTSLIWIVYPLSRTVLVVRIDGSAQHLREDQMLSGETVV